MHNADIVISGQGFRQHLDQAAIQFNCHHLGSGFSQTLRERPNSRTNFQDRFSRTDIGSPYNAIDDIFVNEKVLP
ncbi:hypothetical protein SDC9_186266 [bioreactor metagenome]|uniref:Uncharacterized protein n=1 Tax=bioreactor metagenome TaxID=1076179 RepID=A0A645HI84_9ZZZZ